MQEKELPSSLTVRRLHVTQRVSLRLQEGAPPGHDSWHHLSRPKGFFQGLLQEGEGSPAHHDYF